MGARPLGGLGHTPPLAPKMQGLPCDSSSVYGALHTVEQPSYTSALSMQRWGLPAGPCRAAVAAPASAPLLGEAEGTETPAVRPRRYPGRAYSGGRVRGARRYGARLRAAPGHSRWCSGSPGRVRARASPRPENHAPCLLAGVDGVRIKDRDVGGETRTEQAPIINAECGGRLEGRRRTACSRDMMPSWRTQ